MRAHVATTGLGPVIALSLGLVACGGPDDPAPPADTDVARPVFDGEVVPRPPVVRRLTAVQYRNAVADLFGPDIVPPTQLDADLEVEGFAGVGAGVSAVSPRGAELYEQAALDVAKQAFTDPAWRAAYLPCQPEGADDTACLEQVFSDLATRAWRRPVTSEESDALVDLAAEGIEALGDLGAGMVYGAAFVLQAPDFLYRVEAGVVREDGTRWYSGYEMAERLAFTLWNRLPDAELLQAAADGALDTEEGVRAQAERMLASPAAEEGLLAFFEDLYDLGKLPVTAKDPEIYPQASAALKDAAREQTRRDLAHLVFTLDGDYRTLFDKDWTHVDRALAALYRVPAPSLDGFALAELPEAPGRAGLLGHASTLMLHAHPTSTSATRRGIFVRDILLCQVIPPPPAGVNTAIPEATEAAPTRRDRVIQHLEDPTCAACHRLVDPIGLGLETYDGIGLERETENGVRIDASGDLDGVEFDGPEGLATAVSRHPNLAPCLVEQLYTHAQGRRPEMGEEPSLEYLSDLFAWSGFRVRGLLVELVASEVFRRVADPVMDPPADAPEASP